MHQLSDNVDNKELYLFFRLEANFYAIETNFVVEILKLPQLDFPQNLPENIVGVLNYSGITINIFDIRPILNLNMTKYDVNNCVIIVKTSESIFGIIVDNIDDINVVDSDKASTIPYFSEKNLIKLIYMHKNNKNYSILNMDVLNMILKKVSNIPKLTKNLVELFPNDEYSRNILYKRKKNLYLKTENILKKVQSKEKYLKFCVDDTNLALNVKYINSIVKIEKSRKNKIVRIPTLPEYICSVISDKGQFYSILDLILFWNRNKDYKFGIGDIDRRYVVTLALPDEVNLAIYVEDIFDISEFDNEQKIIKNDIVSHLDMNFLSFDLIEKGRTFSILDVEKLMSNKHIYVKQYFQL